jgi:hypothetical protein
MASSQWAAELREQVVGNDGSRLEDSFCDNVAVESGHRAARAAEEMIATKDWRERKDKPQTRADAPWA